MKYVERIAYILLLVAVLMASYNQEWLIVARYIASVGAAGVAVVRLREQYDGQNLRLKRLMRLRRLIGIAYVIGAALMFREYNYWLVAFLIGVILELYTLLVFARTKENDNEKTSLRSYENDNENGKKNANPNKK